MEGIMYAKVAALIGAALVMGIGSIGPSIGQGIIGMKACESIGKNPETAGTLRTSMLLGMGMVETTAIYVFIVALALIYVGFSLQ